MEIEDIQTTPKGNENSNDSRMSSLGHRHTPTLRLSERKRMLFEKRTTSLALIADDDVDLGPMSPLQYSSSPTSCDEDNNAHSFDRNTKQTNFSNLFPGSLKTTASPSSSPFFPNGKSVLFIDESASSAPNSVGTPQPDVPQTTELTTIPEEQSKEMLHEKTPSERMINYQDLRVSFKKSLILGDMVTPTEDDHRMGKNHQKRSYSMSILHENNGQSGSLPKEKMAKLDSSDPSRARTSLTFDGISIPTNKFYSSHNDENEVPATRPPQPFKRHSAPHILSRERERKLAPSRRSKDFGLGLSRKSCGHKIKKPTRPPQKEAIKKKVEMAVLEQSDSLSINESQTTRINDILRNIKNPLEMSRPLFFHEKERTDDDRFIIPDEDVEDEAEAEKSKRKFFKSRSTGAKSFKLSNNMVATMEGGRLSLPKFASAGNTSTTSISPNQSVNDDPAEFSMIDEDFGSEFEEVTGIISKLTNDDEMDAFRSRIPYNTYDAKVIEKQVDTLEMLIKNKVCTEENFKIFIAEPEAHKEEMAKIMDGLVAGRPAAEASNLFPIFYNQQQRQSKQKLVGLGETGKRNSGGVELSRKVWKKIGDTQLQIDAGQKRYGAVYCPECDLLYSVHEPEDELMHDRFHSALSVLSFAGWKQEKVIREMPQWGPKGRIIAVPWNDHKVKVHRAKVVLKVINKEMGCPDLELDAKMIVYFAVAHNVILGACVAESRYSANRMVTEGGVDYFSEENYRTLCGISRIWVAAPYRNQGVASELVNAVRIDFAFGGSLAFDEIAFQSPTEAGKLLAQKLANRKDFLVYP